MHIESHATPAQITPEQRYAVLHRAIERGMVSDAVWKELTEVSIALGHTDEALRCIDRIENEATRNAFQARMRRHPGLISRTNGHSEGSPEAERVHAPANRLGGSNASGDADKDKDKQTDWDKAPTLAEHVVDAVQFLFIQHMPWLGLLATLSFPLIVGLGGFLTAGISPLGVAAISALPGICMLSIVCAMGRKILLEATRGAIDPPAFPEVRTLVTDTMKWCVGGAVVLAMFAAPIVATILIETEFYWLASTIALGVIFSPMAFVITQVRGVAMALSPWRLIVAVTRGGPSYLGLAITSWAMLAPTALVTWYVLGQPLWVQISAIGPTAVLPVFVCARMLGTWFDTRHQRLADLLVAKPEARNEPPGAQQRQKAGASTQQQRANRQRQERIQRAPGKRPATGNGAPRGERSQPRRSRQAAGAKRTAPRAIEGRSPRRTRLDESPDLRYMPGAVTVSGRERAASKATTRRR